MSTAQQVPTPPPTGPVMTRNARPGVTVFRDKDDTIEWEALGDNMGRDYQPIPRHMLDNPRFMRIVRQGVIVIEDESPEVEQAMARQAEIFAKREAESEANIDRQLDNTGTKDLIAEECVGPNPKGAGTCATMVPVKQEHRGQQPPLCATHQHLVTEFVLTHDVDDLDDNDRPKAKWTRTTISREALPSQAQV